MNGMLWGVVLASAATVACRNEPQEATGAKFSESGPPSTAIVRLAPQDILRTGIQVQPVMKGEFRTSRDFPATVQPNANRLAEITTLVRGRAVDIPVDVGQDVNAGDLLATLDSSELALAQSAYLKAMAKLLVAERAFQRAKSLLDEHVIPQAEYQRREGERISAQAEVREARTRLRLYGMTEEQIGRLEKDQTIRSTVRIVAPFAGRVIVRNLTKGEVVDTNVQLFALADLSDVWVLANVPEKDIPFIQRDQPVEVRLIAYPGETFEGRITYVADVLDPATRTLRLRVTVPNPEKRLRPEMFAKVRLWSPPEHGVLTVPTAAVQQDQGEHVVFVQVSADEFARRPVRLGEETDGAVRVLDGLKEGDPVVIQGAFELKSELINRLQPGLLP